MSLPKEPRQKMINIMYLVLTAILALNVSAEILNAFKVVDSSLLKSNAAIDGSNKYLLESLQQKLSDPQSKERAVIWKPKADEAKRLSDALIAKIETYKDSLKRASGFAPEKGIDNYKEDDLEAATRLFIVNGKGPQLQKDLTTLKDQLLNLDPKIKAEFATKLPIDVSVPPSTTGSENSWEYNYFHMTPTVAALTILSKFENDVKNAENQVVNFCHTQIGKVEIIYSDAVALVSQSSDYVMPGQKIKVKAGVGMFSAAALPQVSINGQSLNASAGFAETEFDAGGAGLHTIPVNITYKDQNGQPKTVQSKVEYTVGVPGGAAVMLDKMNVFYIGVPNPVTISSGSGWDRTTVSMSGGSLSGSGSNRVVTVSTIGKATINVSAEGKSSSFEFRVKEIPNPVFKVGPGGTRMTSGSFKNQQFCRAELENFDFAASFNVVSAKVYFSGAGFPSVQVSSIAGNNLGSISSFMQRCGPGSSITFDEVKVQGPDGKQRTIQGVGIVLY